MRIQRFLRAFIAVCLGIQSLSGIRRDPLSRNKTPTDTPGFCDQALTLPLANTRLPVVDDARLEIIHEFPGQAAITKVAPSAKLAIRAESAAFQYYFGSNGEKILSKLLPKLAGHKQSGVTEVEDIVFRTDTEGFWTLEIDDLERLAEAFDVHHSVVGKYEEPQAGEITLTPEGLQGHVTDPAHAARLFRERLPGIGDRFKEKYSDLGVLFTKRGAWPYTVWTVPEKSFTGLKVRLQLEQTSSVNEKEMLMGWFEGHVDISAGIAEEIPIETVGTDQLAVLRADNDRERRFHLPEPFFAGNPNPNTAVVASFNQKGLGTLVGVFRTDDYSSFKNSGTFPAQKVMLYARSGGRPATPIDPFWAFVRTLLKQGDLEAPAENSIFAREELPPIFCDGNKDYFTVQIFSRDISLRLRFQDAVGHEVFAQPRQGWVLIMRAHPRFHTVVYLEREGKRYAAFIRPHWGSFQGDHWDAIDPALLDHYFSPETLDRWLGKSDHVPVHIDNELIRIGKRSYKLFGGLGDIARQPELRLERRGDRVYGEYPALMVRERGEWHQRGALYEIPTVDSGVALIDLNEWHLAAFLDGNKWSPSFVEYSRPVPKSAKLFIHGLTRGIALDVPKLINDRALLVRRLAPHDRTLYEIHQADAYFTNTGRKPEYTFAVDLKARQLVAIDDVPAAEPLDHPEKRILEILTELHRGTLDRRLVDEFVSFQTRARDRRWVIGELFGTKIAPVISFTRKNFDLTVKAEWLDPSNPAEGVVILLTPAKGSNVSPCAIVLKDEAPYVKRLEMGELENLRLYGRENPLMREILGTADFTNGYLGGQTLRANGVLHRFGPDEYHAEKAVNLSRGDSRSYGVYLKVVQTTGRPIGSLYRPSSDSKIVSIGNLGMWAAIDYLDHKKGADGKQVPLAEILFQMPVPASGVLEIRGRERTIQIPGLEKYAGMLITAVPKKVSDNHSLLEIYEENTDFSAPQKWNQKPQRVLGLSLQPDYAARTFKFVDANAETPERREKMNALDEIIQGLQQFSIPDHLVQDPPTFTMVADERGGVLLGSNKDRLFEYFCKAPHALVRVSVSWIEPARPLSGATIAFEINGKSETFLLHGTRPYITPLKIEDERAERDRALSHLVEEELEDLFGEEHLLFMATRYSVDMRNLIWALLGPRLAGRYDEAKVNEIFNQKLVSLVDQNADRADDRDRRRRLGTAGSAPQTQGGLLETAPLTRDDVNAAAEAIETQIEAMKQMGAITESIDLAEMRARAFLRKLEEELFYQNYATTEFGGDLKQEVDFALDALARMKPPRLVEEAFFDLLTDVDEARTVQEKLYDRGLNRKTTLSLFQLLAIVILHRENRHLLGDEMGLGKTLEILCAFIYSDEQELVVVAPKEALRRWMEDIAEHLHLPLEIVILSSKEAEEDLNTRKDVSIETFDSPEARYHYLQTRTAPEGRRRIILINDESLPSYAALKPVDEPLLKTGMLAIDEAHRFKNPNTKMNQVLFGDEKGLGCVVANNVYPMSGTFVENEATDLIPALQLIARAPRLTPAPSVSGNRLAAAEMLDDHFKTKTYKELVKILGGKGDLGMLSTLTAYLALHLLRRLKDLVLRGLPPKHFHTVYLHPLTGQMQIDDGPLMQLEGNFIPQYRAYEEFLQNAELSEQRYQRRQSDLPAIDNVEEDLPIGGMAALQLMRLEQITLVASQFSEGADSIKMAAAAAITKMEIEKETPRPGLVFSSYITAISNFDTQMRDLIGDEQVTYVDGGTSGAKRSVEIKKFQKTGEAKLFNATVGTMGQSQHLTRAEFEMFLNYPWKPSTFDQAVDRAHRREKDPEINFKGKKLDIYSLVYDVPGFSIDREKRRLLQRKSILAQMLLSGNLAPELLAAFKDTDQRIVDLLHRAQDPVELDDHEQGLMEEFQQLLTEIYNASESDRPALWDKASIIYQAIIEHKSSFFANMAGLDLLSQHPPIQTEVKRRNGKPLETLDVCSGPSTLLRAYLRKLREKAFRTSGLLLNIFDFDGSIGMLLRGIRRQGGQYQGDIDKLGEIITDHDRFDLINLSYALRYAKHPAQLIRTINRLLRVGGRVQFILPSTNEIPSGFFAAMERAGFTLETMPGENLLSELKEMDPEIRRQFETLYGPEFAADMAKEVSARFTYLRAVKKIDNDDAVLSDDDFRIKRKIPRLTPERIAKLASRPGKRRIVHPELPIGGRLDSTGSSPQRAITSDGYHLLRRVGKRIQTLTRLTMRHQSADTGARAELDDLIRKELANLQAVLTKSETLLESIRGRLIDELRNLQTRNQSRQWFAADPKQALPKMMVWLKTRGKALQRSA